jgi:hypothetical protein
MMKTERVLADVAISGNRNVTKQEAGTVNFRLCNRITARVKCKVQVTPAIMGATGTIRKSSTRYLMNEPG